MNSSNMIPKSFGTHDGTFHADEITSCALLLVFNCIDYSKIIRTRDPLLLETCEYVCDVGSVYNEDLKRFDHHQNEYTGSLSSAGMVLRYLHTQKIIDEGLFHLLSSSFVDGVDAHDIGCDILIPGVATFSHIISNFQPIAYDATLDEQQKAFFEALDFVVGHISRLCNRYTYTQSVKQTVEDAMKPNESLLVFDQPVPWIDCFFELGGENHPAQFIIMPTRDHWKLRTIPPTALDKMKMRRPLPKSWGGLRDRELEAQSGVLGAIFCHKALFLSVWETKEQAVQAALIALRNT